MPLEIPAIGRAPGGPTGRTILVVDGHPDTAAALRLLLEGEGHRVLVTGGGPEALVLLEREPVQLMLVDLQLPGTTGEDLVRQVREHDALVQIVLQARGPDRRPPRELLASLAVQGYHDKADGPAPLLLWVDAALRTYDQLAQLHVAERLKTELLANVSHEFRTPLNVIAGYMELLRDGTFGTCPSEALPVCDKVLANTGYLLQLVEEFLDLSRFEAGALTAHPQAIELTPFLRELGESFALLVRAKPVAFRVEVPDGLPAVLVAGAKLRVVVQNLLANAEKFTPQGTIRLAASVEPGDRVAIAVQDTGPGIPTEHHEAIFDIFHQLKPHEGGHKGIGLGLALARRFTRAMGGEITVASTVGIGTTFTVRLPTRRAVATAAA